jgi:hypothetical protein
MYYSEYLVDIMGCVLNVGYVTNSHTTMMIHLYVTKKRKKEKKRVVIDCMLVGPPWVT